MCVQAERIALTLFLRILLVFSLSLGAGGMMYSMGHMSSHGRFDDWWWWFRFAFFLGDESLFKSSKGEREMEMKLKMGRQLSLRSYETGRESGTSWLGGYRVVFVPGRWNGLGWDEDFEKNASRTRKTAWFRDEINRGHVVVLCLSLEWNHQGTIWRVILLYTALQSERGFWLRVRDEWPASTGFNQPGAPPAMHASIVMNGSLTPLD